MPVFVLGRAVQGLSGGTIVAIYVAVAAAYPEELRPRALGLLSASWVLPSVLGPPVAGWLAESVSWRWVFLGVVPLALAALAVALPAMGVPPTDPEMTARDARRRVRQAGLLAVGVVLLQYAGQRLDLWSVPLAAVGLALMAPMLRRLLPAGTLRAARGVPSIVLLRGVMAGAFFGADAFVPLMLVDQRGLSPGVAGLALTTAAVGWAGGSLWQGRPSSASRRPVLVRVGTLAVLTGIALAAAAVADAVPAALAAVGWAFAGLGMGLSISGVSVLLLERSEETERGTNVAALQLSDALGGTLLIAGAGVLHSALHVNAGLGAASFVTVFAVMGAVTLVGTALAGRLGPARRRALVPAA
ncbi:MFS transporter [Motilibacter deserti]|uniref:MFS transporter n=1 Tax=Motilibacter deserti TaxID=2714956 RepID=A0ABX0GSZ8_9ACTN|nr:MFS transporter [Motilibacter deserti]